MPYANALPPNSIVPRSKISNVPPGAKQSAAFVMKRRTSASGQSCNTDLKVTRSNPDGKGSFSASAGRKRIRSASGSAKTCCWPMSHTRGKSTIVPKMPGCCLQIRKTNSPLFQPMSSSFLY